MKILVAYRAIPHAPGWATGESLIRAFRQLGHEAHPYAKIHRSDEWIPAPLDFTPGLIVYCECNDADRQYSELLKTPIPKVYWEFDTALHEEVSSKWWEYFDFNFIANPDYLSKAPRSRYLPYAADTLHFGPCTVAKDGAAIIGTPFNGRLAFAKSIGADVIYDVFQHDYVKALSSLKVNIHQFSSGGDSLLVMRIWETMSVCTCLLSERNKTMDRHFSEGVHYEGFSGEEEAREKISAILADDERRTRIEKAGYQEILERHTYLHRAKEILAAIQ